MDRTIDDQSLGAELVAKIRDDFPGQPHTGRPIHTCGIGAEGFFQPSPVARRYSNSPVFNTARTNVAIRFSNGSGDHEENDNAADVHGMAVKLHVDEGVWDLVGMTLAEFFVRTPGQFIDFTEHAIPQPTKRVHWWDRWWAKLNLRLPPQQPATPTSATDGLMNFANRHSYARAGILGDAMLYRPVSWVRAQYHTIHVFGITGPDGVRRRVRFRWDPVIGIRPAGDLDIGADGLRTDLRARLADAPASFQLRMTVAEAGDPIDDPTVGWPEWRHTVVMGTLWVTAIAADQERDGEAISFNPARLAPGIDPPLDHIFAARRAAYAVSCAERGGLGCPVKDAP
ncbi:MAG: catalase [Actinomycetota bacterium]